MFKRLKKKERKRISAQSVRAASTIIDRRLFVYHAADEVLKVISHSSVRFVGNILDAWLSSTGFFDLFLQRDGRGRWIDASSETGATTSSAALLASHAGPPAVPPLPCSASSRYNKYT
jgi:hypothetical protein